jgi:hypothetical protein
VLLQRAFSLYVVLTARKRYLGSQMNKLLYAICLALGLGGGYLIWGRAVPTKEVTTTEKVQRKDVTTVIEKKPDGTTTTIVTDRSVTEKSKEQVKPDKSEYSIGAKAQFKNLKDKPTYSLELGKRLTGNLWGTVEGNPNDKSVGVGLRLEF